MIAIVVKVPKQKHFDPNVNRALEKHGLSLKLQESSDAHEETYKTVTNLLNLLAQQERACPFVVIKIDEIDGKREFIKQCKLCIAIGGDGTVLAAQKYLTNQPLIGINSDPERSQGYLTPVNPKDDFFDDYIYNVVKDHMEGKPLPVRNVMRLAVNNDEGNYLPFLNDALFTNSNPAAMSEYLMYCPGRGISEKQRSSGVWVSTPLGSTGAIASAGAHPIPPDSNHFLFKVREPYHGRGRLYELENWFGEQDELCFVPVIDGMRVYVDGHHSYLELEVGERITIHQHQPLTMVNGVPK